MVIYNSLVWFTYSCLHHLLHGRLLRQPDLVELLLHGQGEDPQVHADGHGEDGGHDDHVPGELEPAPVIRRHGGDRGQEGDEDEDCVDDAG